MDFVFEKRIANYIAAARVLLENKGQKTLADVLRFGVHQLKTKTSYDNWNGGQYAHSLFFTVPMDVFKTIADNLSDSEQAIMKEINIVSNEVQNESIESVDISPNLEVVEMDDVGRIRAGAKVFTAFDEYTIGEKVGDGGSGRVFSAKDSVGKPVAIKFLEQDATVKYRRFKNEIYFCEQCQHSNIVKVLDRGCANVGGCRRPFYVMPLFAESLRDKIHRGLKPDEAIVIFTELLYALREAHSHGVVHRDVKPENIMFDKDSVHPILCDFGIAHLPQELKETMVVTKPSDRMANFNYAAPEQRSGVSDSVGPQADLYAAGLILNEMFTRQIAAANGYKKIGDVASGYGFLDGLVDGLFQQDPAKRLCSADKVLAELSARSEISRNERAVQKLLEIRGEECEPTFADLVIVKRSYHASKLLFEFNENIPDAWLTILANGSYHHMSVMGYDTNAVLRMEAKTLLMPIDLGEDESTIKSVCDYFKDWVSSANAKYREHLLAESLQKRKTLEDERKREIARLEKENSIQRMLADL